jgi:hypothetical protein
LCKSPTFARQSLPLIVLIRLVGYNRAGLDHRFNSIKAGPPWAG